MGDFTASLTASRVQLASLDSALVQFRRSVQERQNPGATLAHARAGLTGGSERLPHLDAIQRSFGHHDVTGVPAHRGAAAQEACRTLGAHAYATNGAIALGADADLHTVAHEAAHVIQQRGGVRLSKGVGAPGDVYERHADAVADRVVRGESATDLLDAFAGGSTDTSSVQLVTCGDAEQPEASGPKAKLSSEKLGTSVATDGSIEKCKEEGPLKACATTKPLAGEVGGSIQLEIPVSGGKLAGTLSLTAKANAYPVPVVVKGTLSGGGEIETGGGDVGLSRAIAVEGRTVATASPSGYEAPCLQLNATVTDSVSLGVVSVSDSESRINGIGVVQDIYITTGPLDINHGDIHLDGEKIVDLACELIDPFMTEYISENAIDLISSAGEGLSNAADAFLAPFESGPEAVQPPDVALAAPPLNARPGNRPRLSSGTPVKYPIEKVVKLSNLGDHPDLSSPQWEPRFDEKVWILSKRGVEELPVVIRGIDDHTTAEVRAVDEAFYSEPLKLDGVLADASEAAAKEPTADDYDDAQKERLAAAQEAVKRADERLLALETDQTRSIPQERIEEARLDLEYERQLLKATRADLKSQVNAQAISFAEKVRTLQAMGITEITVQPGQSVTETVESYLADPTPLESHPGDSEPSLNVSLEP